MTKQPKIVNWHLIVIIDPQALPGSSILSIIRLVKQIVNFQFVILDDIDGAVVSPLIQKEGIALKLDELLDMLPGVVQFDWGNFFLFKNYPEHWNQSNERSYPDLIAQTDTTIRAVDDTYLYIYTPYLEVVDLIKEIYDVESIKEGLLSELDYPY